MAFWTEKLNKFDKPTLTKLLLSMIFDILTVIFVTISIVSFFTVGGEGNMTVQNAVCFRYFTIDSNVFAAVCCLVHLIYNLRFVLFDKPIPSAVSTLKFSGSAAVFLTFMTVILFLGPTIGYDLMFAGVVLYLHLICPLLCFFSFCFLDEKTDFPRFTEFFGVAPAFVYGCLYMTMVVFVGELAGGWEDFYGFNIGGFWYIAFLVMMLATYGFSLGILKLQKLSFAKK